MRQVDLDDFLFTEIWVQLERILDCRDIEALGLRYVSLFDDYDYSLGQALSQAAFDRDIEALLVPSTTRLGDNLIIFPHRVRAGSVIVEVRAIDPALVKYRLPEEGLNDDKGP